MKLKHDHTVMDITALSIGHQCFQKLTKNWLKNKIIRTVYL